MRYLRASYLRYRVNPSAVSSLDASNSGHDGLCRVGATVAPSTKQKIRAGVVVATTTVNFRLDVARNDLDRATLVALFAWDEDEFLRRTEGSAIRRSGHERWLRNLAVALGNAPTTPEVVEALRARRAHPSPIVREHAAWALEQHTKDRRVVVEGPDDPASLRDTP